MTIPDRDTVDSWLKGYGDACTFRRVSAKRGDDAQAEEFDREARRLAGFILDGFDTLRRTTPAADVLTDELIERVADRVSRMLPWQYPGPNPDARRVVEQVFREERTPTFRFVVEIAAPDVSDALNRLKPAIGPGCAALQWAYGTEPPEHALSSLMSPADGAKVPLMAGRIWSHADAMFSDDVGPRTVEKARPRYEG